MKKIFTTILTLAVLGGGYVGAKALEYKAEVRQDQAWYESTDGTDQNFSNTPLPASFNPSDCNESERTCAALFEVDPTTGERADHPVEDMIIPGDLP